MRLLVRSDAFLKRRKSASQLAWLPSVIIVKER
jgi:hypothetical protein